MVEYKTEVALLFSHLRIILLMRILFIVSLFNCALSHAQQEHTYTVKKQKPETFVGTFCTEYLTDGRTCFEFDTAGTVHFFVWGKDLKSIALTPHHNYFSVPFIQKNDSIFFHTLSVSNPAGLPKIEVLTQYTAWVGNKQMNMNITTTATNATYTPRHVVLYKVD